MKHWPGNEQQPHSEHRPEHEPKTLHGNGQKLGHEQTENIKSEKLANDGHAKNKKLVRCKNANYVKNLKHVKLRRVLNKKNVTVPLQQLSSKQRQKQI